MHVHLYIFIIPYIKRNHIISLKSTEKMFRFIYTFDSYRKQETLWLMLTLNKLNVTSNLCLKGISNITIQCFIRQKDKHKTNQGTPGIETFNIRV